MVGGTTYIPFIRNGLRDLGFKVDDSIDPTTAVIVGASYYAGAHPQTTIKSLSDEQPSTVYTDEVKLSFEAYSNDPEELIAFKLENPFTGFYRITRNDGGFDSGLKAFSQTGSEFVTLLPKRKNTFKLSILNEQQRVVFETNDIGISQGLYSVSGQLLPEDICIELDGKEDNTYLEVIFKRNSVLPLKRTLYKTFSRSIIKNSADKVIINVVEGKSGTMPGSNLTIGYIEISGNNINSDLIQGTDIEIHIEMDESRGLKVDIYIPSTGQEISKSFHIANREISIEKMLHDISLAESLILKEITESDKKEAYELSALFKKIADELKHLKMLLHATKDDQVTEEKYRLDERKRKLLSELDQLTRARDVYIETSKYNTEKERYLSQETYAKEDQKNAVKRIFDEEKEMLRTADKHLIKKTTEKLKEINNKVAMQNDEIFIGIFWNISSFPETFFKTTANRNELIETGKQAIADRDYLNLKHIVNVLYNQLDDRLKKQNTPTEEHVQFLSTDKNFKTGLK